MCVMCFMCVGCCNTHITAKTDKHIVFVLQERAEGVVLEAVSPVILAVSAHYAAAPAFDFSERDAVLVEKHLG